MTTGCLNDVIYLNDTRNSASWVKRVIFTGTSPSTVYSYIFLERNLFVGYYDYTRVPTIGFLLGFVISHMHSVQALPQFYSSVNLMWGAASRS